MHFLERLAYVEHFGLRKCFSYDTSKYPTKCSKVSNILQKIDKIQIWGKNVIFSKFFKMLLTLEHFLGYLEMRIFWKCWILRSFGRFLFSRKISIWLKSERWLNYREMKTTPFPPHRCPFFKMVYLRGFWSDNSDWGMKTYLLTIARSLMIFLSVFQRCSALQRRFLLSSVAN